MLTKSSETLDKAVTRRDAVSDSNKTTAMLLTGPLVTSVTDLTHGLTQQH